jgi:hypothetical protein
MGRPRRACGTRTYRVNMLAYRNASTCRSRKSEISFCSTTASPSVSPMNSRCPCATAAARLPWIARPAYGSDASVSETSAIVLVTLVRRLRAMRLGR